MIQEFALDCSEVSRYARYLTFSGLYLICLDLFVAIDHRQLKAEVPVRSLELKQLTDQVVLWLETTREFWELIVLFLDHQNLEVILCLFTTDTGIHEQGF